MHEIGFRNDSTSPFSAVTDEHPFPVVIAEEPTAQNRLPPVAGETRTVVVQVPGIHTGSAYADGDAFGTKLHFENVFRPGKHSGTIVGAFYLDNADAGYAKDLPLFIRDFTQTADDSAFGPSDGDLLACRGVVQIATAFNWANNQWYQATNVGLWIAGESPHLWTQLVERGVSNLSAPALAYVGLVVIPD